MKRKIKLGIVGIGIVVLVIFLCFSLFAPTKENNVIRVSYQPGNINCAQFYVAYVNGFFSEHNVTVETIPLTSGNEIKLALSTGQIDVAFAGSVNFFAPISKGVPIKIIAPMATAHSYLFVRPDNKTRTFEDLIGKSIAVSPGGSNDYAIRRILKKENIDANKINFVGMDETYKPIALMDKKTIDAVPVGDEQVLKYSEIGAVLLEEWGAKGYSNQYMPQSVIVIDENFKESNPRLVELFIDAIIEGNRFIKSNPKEAAEVIATYIKNENEGVSVYSPEDLTSMWENEEIKYTLWYDPTILVEMSRTATELGQIDSNLTLNQIYDLSFEEKLKNAQNEIYNTN